MKKLLLVSFLGLCVSSSSFAASQVMCHFNSFVDHADSYTSKRVSSSHNLTIINNTAQNKHYYISYQTLIDKNIVHTKNLDITLVPNQKFTQDLTIETWRLFRDRKNYDASCRTTIMGDEENQISGGGYIRIT